MNNVRGVYIYRYIEPNDIYKTFIRRIGRSANARPSMYSKDNCFAYDSSSLEFWIFFVFMNGLNNFLIPIYIHVLFRFK